MYIVSLGVEIFAVGVGRQINQTALQQIASVPPASHFFYIESFQDLQTLTGLVNSSEIGKLNLGAVSGF